MSPEGLNHDAHRLFLSFLTLGSVSQLSTDKESKGTEHKQESIFTSQGYFVLSQIQALNKRLLSVSSCPWPRICKSSRLQNFFYFNWVKKFGHYVKAVSVCPSEMK